MPQIKLMPPNAVQAALQASPTDQGRPEAKTAEKGKVKVAAQTEEKTEEKTAEKGKVAAQTEEKTEEKISDLGDDDGDEKPKEKA